MKRAGICCLLLIAHLLLFALPCLAGDRAGAFSISPFFGGYSFDGTQQIETKPVYGLRLGYDATKNLAIEGVFAYVNTEATRSSFKLNLYSYRLDLLYNLMPDSKLVPYLAMGGGCATKDPAPGPTYTDMTFNFGGGVKYFFTESVALRGDVRQLLVFADTTVNNWEYSVGLSFLFGGGKAPAKHEPVPEPVVKPSAKAKPVPEPAAKPSGEAEPVPEPAAKPSAKAEPVSEPAAKPAPKVEATPSPAAPSVSAPGVEPTADKDMNRIVLNILFYKESAIILDESHDEIGKVATIMKNTPAAKAVFDGHNAEKSEYNIVLSQRRVESVVNYLVEKFGIDRPRISVKGYGEARPAAKFSFPGGKDKGSINVVFDCLITK